MSRNISVIHILAQLSKDPKASTERLFAQYGVDEKVVLVELLRIRKTIERSSHGSFVAATLGGFLAGLEYANVFISEEEAGLHVPNISVEEAGGEGSRPHEQGETK